MYDITVEAPELKGLSIVKQHRKVNEVMATFHYLFIHEYEMVDNVAFFFDRL